MKTYLDYINEATIQGTQKLIDALKKKLPDADLSKVDTKITLDGMWGTLYGGYKQLFEKRCANDKNLIQKTLEILAEMFGEQPKFMIDVYNGNIPRSSKNITLNAKVKTVFERYFRWDTGINYVTFGNSYTLKDVVNDLKTTKVSDLGLGDSEFENYLIWLVSVASGRNYYKISY